MLSIAKIIMEVLRNAISISCITFLQNLQAFFFILSIISGTKDFNCIASTDSRTLNISQRDYYAEIRLKIPDANNYCAANDLNTDIYFLIDMQQHSGSNRFYIYSRKFDSVLHTGLVAHGSGDAAFAATPIFSNVAGSKCTSLGHYKIGVPYIGNFGKAYKLHGLDSSNSNAFSRYVVLHSYQFMPNEETYPEYLMNSQGCPMISEKFMEIVSTYINHSKKQILLWIY